jgi:hypothetical protein
MRPILTALENGIGGVSPLRVFSPLVAASGSFPPAPARIGSAGSRPMYGCGWDVQNNLCWAEPWCEPSVISSDPFLYRPASAVCPAGTGSYTYAPGTMMVWGPAVSGSVQGPTSAVTGYLCVPNSAPVTIKC